MHANRELAIRWREARVKKLAEQKEGEEGYIVKQAPQGFEPERITRKPRKQEEDADDLGPELDTSASSRAKPKRKVKHPNPPEKDDSKKDKGGKKKGGSVKNTIEEIIEASNLPPGQQALLPPKRLTTTVARPKKGRKKKGGGLEPILEHHDIQNDPYYMKPPLPTHMK